MKHGKNDCLQSGQNTNSHRRSHICRKTGPGYCIVIREVIENLDAFDSNGSVKLDRMLKGPNGKTRSLCDPCIG